MAIVISTTSRNNRATSLVTDIGAGGLIKLYTAAYTTLLGTLTASAVFGTVANGVITANAITQDVAADADGVFALARIYKADGVTMVMEGLTVGTTGTNIITTAASVTLGTAIQMTSFTLTEGNI
jgi:hypothetical protein